MRAAALALPLSADIWFRPPANDDGPAGPRGCRWWLAIETFKTAHAPVAVWLAKQKLAGRDIDACFDELITALEVAR